MREMLNVFRIVFAVVWLLLGAVLLGRDVLLPAGALDRLSTGNSNLIGAVALVVGSYNVLRIYLNWRKRNPRVVVGIGPPPPLARRVQVEPEYNPDLYFEKNGEAGK